MTSLLDTFLNHDEYSQVCSRVGEFLDELTKLPREKKLKRIKQLFEFKKLFSTDSVQGMAGMLQIDTGIETQVDEGHHDTVQQDIVFKVSIEINRSIEHEFFVLKKLNSLRSYCPNFVGTLGLLPAYVTRDFFDEDYKRHGNIMDVKANPVQTNYLLLEYVSDVTFRHVWKYAPKGTVLGVLMGVLCALQIAQNKHNFVHYDLHSDNILMRKVEDDSYFAYVIQGEVYMYPTFGWYPVMIDMGSSYIKGIEERPTRTSIAHYHRGLQSTFFDQVSDTHHFLLSALSRLEKADSQSEGFRRSFRVLATRIMHMFRHSNIWRYNGWKQLPHNLVHMFNSLVNKTRPEVCEFFTELRSNVVDTLALGVKLPWTKMSHTELVNMMRFYYPNLMSKLDPALNDEVMLMAKASIEDINHFLSVFDDDSLTKADSQVLYALRTLVEHASLLEETEDKTFSVSQATITTFKQVMQPMYPTLNYKLDLNRSFRGAAVICKLMRHLLFHFNAGNVDLVTEWNATGDLHKPLDAVRFLQHNIAVRKDFMPTSLVYVWDSDAEKSHRVTFEQLGITEDRGMEEAVKRYLKTTVK